FRSEIAVAGNRIRLGCLARAAGDPGAGDQGDRKEGRGDAGDAQNGALRILAHSTLSHGLDQGRVEGRGRQVGPRGRWRRIITDSRRMSRLCDPKTATPVTVGRSDGPGVPGYHAWGMGDFGTNGRIDASPEAPRHGGAPCPDLTRRIAGKR